MNTGLHSSSYIMPFQTEQKHIYFILVAKSEFKVKID